MHFDICYYFELNAFKLNAFDSQFMDNDNLF